MKTHEKQQGSALILTLMLLALMLTLVLYYVSLIKIEAQVSGFTTSHYLSREALELATSEALAALEMRHSARLLEGKVTLSPTSFVDLVSRGTGGVLTGAFTEVEIQQLGWPLPAEVVAQLDHMEWVILGESTTVHSAYAWGLIPLTGLLDPEGLSGWSVGHLGFDETRPLDEVYLSATEFKAKHPGAAEAFMPGNYSRDRGWFDFSSSTWQTNTVMGAAEVSMHPLAWTDAEVLEVMKVLYPTRDAVALAEAFIDFRDGKTLPSNPDGLSAVPVPMFNEVTASMTVTNLGNDVISISHQVDVEIWYPFEGNLNTNRYEVAMTPALEARNGNSASLSLPSVASEDDWTFDVPGGDAETAFAILTLHVTPYQVIQPVGAVLEVDWNLENLTLEQLGGGIADRLPSGLKLEMPAMTVPASGRVERVTLSLEVVDPGLNYQPELWVPRESSTLSAVNAVAIDAQADEELADGWSRWTPVGKEGQWKEGWVGYFPLDGPWRSVDLFSEEGQWWLQHTRSPEWEPGEWRRDRINPYGLYVEPLTAAFVGVPRFKYPEELGADTFSVAEAEVFAENLVAATLLDENGNQRGSWSSALEAALLADLRDRHQAEAILQEILERVDIGHHLYGLILMSEARSPGGRVQNRSGEMMILWMDAYPDVKGRFPLMKILRHPIK
ncbi:hypothetical protein P3T73_07575 [Kiritimatiellota bacterium B12222]|nr:hypothetical protein P3T73_07575 [Kiritimatiellota bacterium B12222]